MFAENHTNLLGVCVRFVGVDRSKDACLNQTEPATQHSHRHVGRWSWSGQTLGGATREAPCSQAGLLLAWAVVLLPVVT